MLGARKLSEFILFFLLVSVILRYVLIILSSTAANIAVLLIRFQPVYVELLALGKSIESRYFLHEHLTQFEGFL